MKDIQLLMIMSAGGCSKRIVELLEKHDVYGFTEIPDLLGAGATGKHFGTRAFPGMSSMIFTAVPTEVGPRVLEDLGELSCQCRPGEGIKAYMLGAQAPLWTLDDNRSARSPND